MLKIGERVPDFSLTAQDGKTYCLENFKAKILILYFYPKDLTSGCTQQACDLRDAFSEIQEMNATIVGVSKDTISQHQKFQQKYDLPFLLLSDPNTEAAKAYGVWKEKSLYGRKYMGIERTTFAISPTGELLSLYPKVRVSDHLKWIRKTLKST